MNKLIPIFLVLSFVFTTITGTNAEQVQGNTKNQSFSKAKKILQREVYNDHMVTFYCGCEFSPDKSVSHSNGYKPKKTSKRANRLEWEHVVPAHAFGQSFKEWREGHPDCVDSKGKPFKGRNCARKVAIKFRYMEADMYNLVPAVGEINGLRSNYSFAMIEKEKREFGTCDMEIENSKAEPPPEVRGNIARIYFYMDTAYPGHGVISRKNRKLFEAWDKEDPVDAWECERNKRIEKLQGNENRKTTEGYLHSVGEAERNAMRELEKVEIASERLPNNSKRPTNLHPEYWMRKVKRPDYETLCRDIKALGYVGTGKKYGVSDNAIRKWKKHYERQFDN